MAQIAAFGDMLAALAAPSRMAMLEHLAVEPRPVQDIAYMMPISRPAVSQHLQILKQAGLVTETVAGRRRVYAAAPMPLARLAAHLDGLARRAERGGGAPVPKAPESDFIDEAVAGWAVNSLGMEPETVAAISRLLLAAKLMEAMMSRLATRYGLTAGEAMLLGTLRRIGPPYRSTPTELSHLMIAAPPGVAKRLSRLQRMKLVERAISTDDQRSHDITLTAKGCSIADAFAVENLSSNYAPFFALKAEARVALAKSLRELLPSLIALSKARSSRQPRKRAAAISSGRI
jgi:DNA-binding MarR family transcriptional regulator